VGNKIKVGKKAVIYPHAIFRFINGGSITIGDNCMLEDFSVISTSGGDIRIGNDFSIQTSSTIYGGGGLTIGNDVMIASNVVVVPAGHNFERVDIPIRKQGSLMKGIVIEDDVWIGCGCRILDGVKIGKGSVIGAGSVVNKNIEEYSVVVGVPGKIIRKRQLNYENQKENDK
jgi:acetyltransferase-like isoleucine patch superfamily enzyme